jgi:hypothetical protein
MKTKVEHKNSELISILKKELGWHQARIKFLAGIITAMIKLQTVSFVRLSQGFCNQQLKVQRKWQIRVHSFWQQ